ncbi:Aquaporin-1 [Paragonimus heterotremus]|uniref:Aquaporin-1 n=1 Tax=Paragonimus heterotremus TaxID=100268 RepID=A0A8J4TH10_9TREM|nr:Aquaporin-1 [Paragonimus heterotremus]
MTSVRQNPLPKATISSKPSRDWYYARFLLRVCFSEMFAVTMLTFSHIHYDVTVLYNMPTALPGSIVFGWAVWIFGPISGPQLSPIVTIALLITRRITILSAIASVVGQILGVIFGFLLALGLAANTHPLLHTPAFGMTTVNHVTAVQAFGLEFLAGISLIWVILATFDEFRPTEWSQGHTSIFFGIFFLTIMWLGGMLGSYTGCSLSPFRSLIPAIFNGNYENLWVYIVGPLTASVVAPLIYETVLSDGASISRLRAWFTQADFDRRFDYKRAEENTNCRDKSSPTEERL